MKICPGHFWKNNKILFCELFFSGRNCVQICKCWFSKFLSAGVQKKCRMCLFFQLRENTAFKTYVSPFLPLLCNSITRPSIVLEGCSNAKKIWQVFKIALKNFFQSFEFQFFVGDIINGVSFRPFWLRLPGPGHQPLDGIFDSSFYWKLGYNVNLLSRWLDF